MSARLLAAFVAVVTAALVVASPAAASLGVEVTAGQSVAAQLQRGKTSCDALTNVQFEHLGEYVMDRTVGSRAAHAAMNARMTRAIGTKNTDRMHELMGRRFAGCVTGGAASGAPTGPGMMDGSGSGDGWGTMNSSGSGWGMMNGSDWNWMHNGSWQHMSGSQWRQRASTMMGGRYASPSHHGWSTTGVVGVVLGALLVGVLLAVLLVRRPWHRPPPATPTAA